MNNQSKKKIEVIILAGGKGTRLAEKTSLTPKPLVKVGNKPVLWHIIQILQASNINNFLIATGYKSKLISEYVNKETDFKKVNIKTHFTGKNSMTGFRILKLKDKIKNENFIVTYGDGVANLDFKKVINHHFKQKKLATMVIVRPPARWGFVKIRNDLIYNFEEKNQLNEGWINGGFFILNKKIFKYFRNKENLVFEKDVLPKLAKDGELVAYKHKSFWQCMDTLKDNIMLNKLWKKNKAPWKIW